MARFRGLLAVLVAVFTLTMVSAELAPLPTGHAAQGQEWKSGVPWAGVLTTNTGKCTVTVVSEFLAITAKHCGRVNPKLKLDVPSLTTWGHNYDVKQIVPNRDLDVEAIFLRERSGLAVTPLRKAVGRNWFYAWGYGADWSGRYTGRLTRADFSLPELCPTDNPELPADHGDLCWETDAKNSVCTGDSGGPVTQDGAIIGILTGADSETKGSRGQLVCSTIYVGQALTVTQMEPWLDQMIDDANPFP